MVRSGRWSALAVTALAVACSGGETEKESGLSGNGQGGSGGQAGGGSSLAVCVAEGDCDVSACASGECFDADRCAAQQVGFWGEQWHDNGQALAVTSTNDRVIVGLTQLGDENDADRDVFVTKLSATGSELWSRKLGTALKDLAFGVAIDASDHVYVTGASEGAFEGHANAGDRDVFVLKLAPDGSTVWSVLFGSAGGDTGYEVALDPQGKVLVTGQWNYDFEADTTQPFLATISADGVLEGAAPLAVDRGQGFTLDVDAQGNAYVTGEKTPPGSGNGDLFAKKLAPDGTELWSLEWASTDDDWTNGAVLDGRGQLYVVGTTAGALEGNPAPATGNWSLFLSLIDASGKLSWTRTYYPDVDTRGGDVTVASNGDLLVAGNVLGKFTLEDETLGVDAFAMRLCPDGSPKGMQRRDMGSDDWTWGVGEAKDGAVLLTGYSFQTAALGAPQDSVDTFLLQLRPE